jgi:hypothetical protein
MALVALGLAACTFPNAPTAVTATAGNGQATVSWTAPTPDAAQITGYVVTPYLNNVAQMTQEFGPTATSGVVTKLANGSTYVFTVETLGLSGGFPVSSNLSSASNPVTPTDPLGTPGQATGVTATAGNSQATVSWTAPVLPAGDQVAQYGVTPYVGGAAQTTQWFLNTATTQTVTGLTNGTTYTFTVTAFLGASDTPESAPSNPVAPSAPPGVPAAPTAVTSSGGNGQATVSWMAPSDNGSPITSYVIDANQPWGGGVNQVSQTTFNSAATTEIVTGLNFAQSYTFIVTAINAVGTGVESMPSGAVVVGAPGMPTGVMAVAGTMQATVSWTAPPDNGVTIAGYDITPYIGGMAQTPQAFVGTATTETVSGLASGTTYTFTVNGVGTNGCIPLPPPSLGCPGAFGPESAPSNAVTIM